MAVETGCFLEPLVDTNVASSATIVGISKDNSRNEANPASRSMLFVETEASQADTDKVSDILDLSDTSSIVLAEYNAGTGSTVAALRNYHILHSAKSATANRTSDEQDITTRNTAYKPTDPQSATIIKQYLAGAEDFRISATGIYKRQDSEVRLSRAFSSKSNLRCALVEYNHAIYRGIFNVLEWTMANDDEDVMRYTLELRASGDVDIDVVNYV